MAKKTYTYRLSEEAKELLSKIAKAEKRSDANMIEVLVHEKAEKLGIKLDN